MKIFVIKVYDAPTAKFTEIRVYDRDRANQAANEAAKRFGPTNVETFTEETTDPDQLEMFPPDKKDI